MQKTTYTSGNTSNQIITSRDYSKHMHQKSDTDATLNLSTTKGIMKRYENFEFANRSIK